MSQSMENPLTLERKARQAMYSHNYYLRNKELSKIRAQTYRQQKGNVDHPKAKKIRPPIHGSQTGRPRKHNFEEMTYRRVHANIPIECK